MNPQKPDQIRVITFIDGQNLYRQANRCFGFSWPNYDPIRLSEEVALRFPDRILKQVRFYTGIPRMNHSRMWHFFWENKIRSHSSNKIFHAFTLPLAYHTEIIEEIDSADGSVTAKPIVIAREKGIDVRLALDVVRLAMENEYDLGLIFSQDRDLHEAVKEVHEIRSKQNRWLILETAFPSCDSIEKQYRRGIPDTDWVKIDRAIYDKCIDPLDYRPSKVLPLFPSK